MSNYSKQREIILETLYLLDHPTADQLYATVHKNNPTISQSTVYRNLNVLLEDNLIRKIKVLGGPDRFDFISKEHYHAICKSCGRVFDFMCYLFNEDFMGDVHSQTGITVDSDSVTVYGICENCKLKVKK